MDKKDRLEQPEQEPAWIKARKITFMNFTTTAKGGAGGVDKSTAPPQRKEWVGLTEEDIAILWKATPQLVGVYSYTDIAREVEAKLKEKNG